MTVSLVPFPVFRALDANGLPLDGGQLFTYASGTLTPLATYTDNTGNSANTNPVILDSTGTANVWCTTGVLYTFVLEDVNGVQQWAVDGIGTSSGGGSTGFAGGFGAATDVASASLVDLGLISSHYAHITGSTTITSFGSSASLDAPIYLLKFELPVTITASGNILTPLSTDITTAANDRAYVEYLGGGAWKIYQYMSNNGDLAAHNITAVNLTETG